MRSLLTEVVRVGPGHAPANALDHLLHAATRLAPRACYGVELVLPAPLERTLLRDALRRTVARFPILGSRLVQERPGVGLGLGPGVRSAVGLGLRWAPVEEDPVHRLLPAAARLEPTAGRTLQAALHRAREAALEAPLQPARGQCFRLHRFDLPPGQQRLLLVASPLLCDLPAWLRVLDELFRQIAAVRDGATEPPMPTERASRSVTGLLAEAPGLGLRSALSALARLWPGAEDVRCLWDALPPDSDTRHQVVRLAPERLGRLKEEAALAGGLVLDGLLACLAQTFEGTDLGLCKDRRGEDLLRLGLAVDLRRFARRRPGLGHFTGLQPLHLDLPLPGSLTALVGQIRPQLERALAQRSALRALAPLTLLGQVPEALSRRLVRRALAREPRYTAVVFDLGPLDRRLPTLLAADVRRVVLYPPAAGFLPMTVAISSWRKHLALTTAVSLPHLAPEEITRFQARLTERVLRLTE